ncbi:MAG: ribosome biogenesis GTPase Der [Candidatus Falkowbacteria bacterium]
MEKELGPIVALVGRTNVGKSTLFNRLTERNQALVSNIENTTRDSNIGPVEWLGTSFSLVDTAGVIDIKYLVSGKAATKKLMKENAVNTKTQKQVADFFKRATLIIFLVDGQSGLLPADKEIGAFLKADQTFSKKTLLAVNKVDNFKNRSEASEFNKLGLGEPVMFSAATGSGTGDLLDLIITKLKVKKNKVKKEGEEVEEVPKINVCIFGKPNVGKSSLLNSLLGYERVIVSEIPHTTREPQNTEIIYKGKVINLIDTAGISKHGHKMKGLESSSIGRSMMMMHKADIVLLMLDINSEITHQDASLISEIVESGKSFVILANKWDLVSERNTKKFTDYIYGKLPFVMWAPLLFISALSGEKVNKIFDLILTIGEARSLRLSDSQLDHFLSRIVKIHKPSKGKGVKHPRIYELSQTHSNPPKFELRIGHADDLHFSYIRFVENRLREKYSFIGTPIKIRVSKTKKIHGIGDAGPNRKESKTPDFV